MPFLHSLLAPTECAAASSCRPGASLHQEVELHSRTAQSGTLLNLLRKLKTPAFQHITCADLAM
jgi:hypothetical protein